MGTTVCTHCSSTKSPLWRRGQHGEILCNACGLYWKHHGSYRPLSLKVAADKKDPPRTKSPASDLPAKRDSNLRRLKTALGGTASADSSARRKMTPLRSKTSAGKIAIPNFFLQSTASGRWRGEPIYAPELPPSAGSANVRLVPADVRESAALDAPIISNCERKSDGTGREAKYIMFRGRLLFIGDHVAVRGDDSQIYFAIVHNFWMVPTGQKYVHLQWLLPKAKYALDIDGPNEKIDASFFTLGPMHDRTEQIESIVDVFFSPQLLQRPLEGPTSIVPSLTRTPSRCTTPHQSGMDGKVSRDDLFVIPTTSSGVDTPTARNGKRAMSDSEIELTRPILISGNQTPIQMPFAMRPTPLPVPGNILEDVEIAHLLCSMT